LKKFHLKIFKDLYFQRWGVEEAFKILKSRVGLEAFSAKTARSLYQDFQTMGHPIRPSSLLALRVIKLACRGLAPSRIYSYLVG